jgi:hypothetical protein
VERHQKTSVAVMSNRKPSEWLTMMADPLLAQSAMDRLTSTCHELVIEGGLPSPDSARTARWDAVERAGTGWNASLV